jgi:DNA invertase Pin-like site-specific DNA recombinase
VLVVAKRDRLARDVYVAATIERAIASAGARVVCADGVANGDTPADAFLRTILDGAAEYERALIRARTRAALAVKRGRGLRVGSVPYGYRLAADGKTLEPHEGEQRVLVIVRDYRAEGLTLRDIGARLEAQGLLPRAGNHWHPQTLARIAEAA